MSKGDRFRAKTVSLQEFDNSFEGIFGVKTPRARWVPPALPVEVIEVKEDIWSKNNDTDKGI